MRLLLIGCTGLVGRALVPMLQAAGHDLTIVSRSSASAGRFPGSRAGLSWVHCNPADPTSWEPSSPLQQALAQAQGVVNLAGEPIAEKRWTEAHLQLLEDSRLQTTHQLVKAMADLPEPPQVLINASAVGYYGTSADQTFDESSPCGNDLLAGLCQRWEAAASKKPETTRLVVLRIGIVLAADGGALGKMLPIFRMGFGGPIGTGRQWMSWIERDDLCRMILAGVENEAWSGVVNAVSPSPATMASFSEALGRCLGRPSLLPVPGPLLKVLLGDGAKVVLEGQRVQSTRQADLGFSCLCSELPAAFDVATSSTIRSGERLP